MDLNNFPLSAEFLNGLGVVGISVFVLLLVIFGKGLALQREVKDRDARIAKQDETIAWQRATIGEKDRQISELIGGTRISATALQKVSQAAEQIAAGGEGA